MRMGSSMADEVQIADVQLCGRGAAGRSGQAGAEPLRRGRPRHQDPRLDSAADMGRIPAASAPGEGGSPSLFTTGRKAAHLVDDVLPRVPVRQWVLSFP